LQPCAASRWSAPTKNPRSPLDHVNNLVVGQFEIS
jgi:hypothetical protein